MSFVYKCVLCLFFTRHAIIDLKTSFLSRHSSLDTNLLRCKLSGADTESVACWSWYAEVSSGYNSCLGLASRIRGLWMIRSEASLIIQNSPFLCTAVHVIICYLLPSRFFAFLFLLNGIRKAGWDVKKYTEKERREIACQKWNNYMDCRKHK